MSDEATVVDPDEPAGEERKFFALIHPGGVGGATFERPHLREQDKEFEAGEFYAAVFFPKINIPAHASFWYQDLWTLSCSPELARLKFMDRINMECKWEQYHDAGWRIRKVRIVDGGDAENKERESD